MSLIIGAGDFGLGKILQDGTILKGQIEALKTDTEAAQVQTAQNKTAAQTAAQSAANFASATALMLAAVQQLGTGGSTGGAGLSTGQVQLADRPNGYSFLHGGNTSRFTARGVLPDGTVDPLIEFKPALNGDGTLDPLRAVLVCPTNETFTGRADFIFQSIST